MITRIVAECIRFSVIALLALPMTAVGEDEPSGKTGTTWIEIHAGPSGFGLDGKAGEEPIGRVAVFLREAASRAGKRTVDVAASSAGFDGSELRISWLTDKCVWKAQFDGDRELIGEPESIGDCASILRKNSQDGKTVPGVHQAGPGEALLSMDSALPYRVAAVLLQALKGKEFTVLLFTADEELPVVCEPAYSGEGMQFSLPDVSLRVRFMPDTTWKRAIEALWACCCVGIRDVVLVGESGASSTVRLPVAGISESGCTLPERTLNIGKSRYLLARKALIEDLLSGLAMGGLDAEETAKRGLTAVGSDAVPFLEKALPGMKSGPAAVASWLLSYLKKRHSDPAGWKGEEWYFAERWDRRNKLRVYGGGHNTESSVIAGLIWLKNHQNPDGSWSCKRFMNNCSKGACGGPGGNDMYDAGLTGLALLAFLGAGHTPYEGKFKAVVDSALRSIRSRQDEEGCVWPKEGDSGWIYCQAVCTMALAEAYAMTFHDPGLKASAQKAADCLAGCRNPGQGWRYGVKPGDSDTSCTAWAASALRIAQMSGLEVPREALDGALNWFGGVTDDTYFRTGYIEKGDPGSRPADTQDRFKPGEAMTAASIFSRILIEGRKALKTPASIGGANLLRQKLPQWDTGGGTIDMYYWYWGSLSMFQLGSQFWKSWNTSLKNAVIPTQIAKGCENGSWDPVCVWGSSGGRVYSTAMNVLSLETYYRYRRVAE